MMNMKEWLKKEAESALKVLL